MMEYDRPFFNACRRLKSSFCCTKGRTGRIAWHELQITYTRMNIWILIIVGLLFSSNNFTRLSKWNYPNRYDGTYISNIRPKHNIICRCSHRSIKNINCLLNKLLYDKYSCFVCQWINLPQTNALYSNRNHCWIEKMHKTEASGERHWAGRHTSIHSSFRFN